jgi:carbon-monoxide dehydrogenase medium subunit
MKPPAFRYHDPETIEEALGILNKVENARLLAGGQSLVPMLNMRFVVPDHLIDLNRIASLSSIEQAGDRIEIGAMTRHQDILRSNVVSAVAPVMTEAIAFVGHRQTRNRGTIGGSLAHLDPAAELVAIAALLDAQLIIRNASGTRTLPFGEFALSYMTTALEPDEMLTGISLPVWPHAHGYGFVEFARRHGDFAIVSAGALLTCDQQGRVTRAALVIGGASQVPIRMPDIEAALVGSIPNDSNLKQACRLCANIDALGDALIDASYRRHLAPVLAQRAFTRARDRLTLQH